MDRRSKPGSRRAALATKLLIACSFAAALVALLGYTGENASEEQGRPSLATKSDFIRPLPFQVNIEIDTYEPF
jgi:hypothetical protein